MIKHNQNLALPDMALEAVQVAEAVWMCPARSEVDVVGQPPAKQKMLKKTKNNKQTLWEPGAHLDGN